MRWRCLTKPMMFQPAHCSRIIASCGALHNFALAHGMEQPDIDDFVNENPEVNANFIDDGAVGGQGNEGIRARQNLVDRLFIRR